MATKFRNPANGYEVEVPDTAWLWTLLFGGFYFAVKGVWRHVAVLFMLALLVGAGPPILLPVIGLALLPFGLALLAVVWVTYPFFARTILETHYLVSGWERLPDEVRPRVEEPTFSLGESHTAQPRSLPSDAEARGATWGNVPSEEG